MSGDRFTSDILLNKGFTQNEKGEWVPAPKPKPVDAAIQHLDDMPIMQRKKVGRPALTLTDAEQKRLLKKFKKSDKSKIINSILAALASNQITYITEYKFHPVRKWRFDIIIAGGYRSAKIAIEFNGGQWTGGGHVRGNHYQSDLDKLNAAQLLGWKVLQYTTSHFDKDGIGTAGVMNDVRKLLEIIHIS